MAYTYETVEVTVEAPIAILALNQPERLNPISPAGQSEPDIRDALRELAADDRVRAIVVTGRGRAFSAGADVRPPPPKQAPAQPPLTAAQRLAWDYPGGIMWKEWVNYSKPTVAAVNGYALGGGWELAELCDCIIAAESAVFGAIEIELGLFPFAMGSQYLPRTVGKHRALELILTGKKISSQEALQMGLVNKVVPDEQLMDEAKALARQIAAMPPLAVRFARMLVEKALNFEENYFMERTLAYHLQGTEDTQAAGKARRERKPMPAFKGR